MSGAGAGRTGTATWAGTAAFALTALPAAITGATAFEAVFVAVALVLFVAGCAAFVAAYARVVRRSRREEIAVAGVYLLMGGSAPGPVRRSLLGALGAQTLLALAAAAARPYTVLAFGVLAPMYGLGLAGLWAARHGTFPPRRPARARPRREEQG